ncbi:hypothetical protein HT886_003444 [Salmonella enterica]|uniref:hypothetical protein n=1 Tax=Salmonella enterica TaxID=28901 RepID=UPI0012830B56|nr:hypothetical protein [Salmonella enterica]EBV2373557.1 hypothetical protein [Salmonella enterica subsp. enterica serovar Enteritidis]ECI4698836.1 hypothetical protein [Salmonella enterica subsp. diarizonae]ECS6774851.1 hypothetical protein [Salmonella enterica subsp. diarizonae serovar 65:z10:e,n,x,z15]MCH5493547.1 hypothetical protein [Salmonella enterica subsp. diarizonae serovar 16:z10:e,n,x,z15]HCM6306505.1 hypothetical protein [Salmonella enterica subsp. enterica serovar 6,14:y:1,7]
MKLTIEDVQVAIKGVAKYGNTHISEKLLAVIAGNYAKGNNIITVHLQSLYEDENFDSIVGEIKNLYYTETDGRSQLRGDIIFDTELLDLQSLLHSLANGCVYLSPYFMNLGSLNHCFACLSSVTLSKAEDTLFDGIEPLDISGLNGLINALYKEPATETPAEPQGDKPYIYAPGMNNEDIAVWVRDIYNNLTKEIKERAELQELKSNSRVIENILDEREAFLSKTIRV